MSESEVTRLLNQIEQEYRASKLGLQGFASGTARHDFIQQRTERIGQCHEYLSKLIGPQEAMALIANAIWTPSEQGDLSPCHAQVS